MLKIKYTRVFLDFLFICVFCSNVTADNRIRHSTGSLCLGVWNGRREGDDGNGFTSNPWDGRALRLINCNKAEANIWTHVEFQEGKLYAGGVQYCLDAFNLANGERVHMYGCHPLGNEYHYLQNWEVSNNRFKIKGHNYCLDVFA
eukprot:Pgem_evm1s8223